MIACKGNINAEYLLFHGYGNGVVYFRVITNAGMQTIQTTAQLALGTWTHVAAVRSGSSAKIYFDGVEAASGTISGTGTTSANPLRIGAGWLGGSASNFLSGRIDEPRIYNRALAPTEITALYENTSPPTSGLVAYIPMEEGTGTTTAVKDSTGSTIATATLTNGPTWSNQVPPALAP